MPACYHPRAMRYPALVAALLMAAGPAAAQPAPRNAPPPVAPEVIARDESGRVTVRAVRLTEPLHVDGALDEAMYRDVQPMSDFVQLEPDDLARATEQTEVWVAFDEDNVYVAMRCLDSDMGSLLANELRRDSGNIFQGNDIAVFMFDTYYD